MSELVALSSELDISRCAQEPIHIPGAIQPHGALLAVQVGGSAITHASANLAAILGRPVEAVLGQTLAAIFGEAAAEALSLAGLSDGTDLRQTLVVPGPDGGFLHLQSHLSGKRICVDIEPLRPALWQQPPVLMAQSVVDTFKAATSCSELCGFAVRGLKLITGYDRVMAYRFDQDGNGEVIAEFCEAELTPYFGQHYPAADVPQQARRQYLSQRVGVIADSSYEPVPLVVDHGRDDGTPLDLTHSALRSASPVHRQYMRNMKTAASLTIGLANGPHLWGMLVCHHTVPRIAGPELRAIADMIGQVVSLLIGSLSAAERYAQQLERNVTLRHLIDRLASPGTLTDTIAAMETELLRLVDASGAVVRLGGTVASIGSTPARSAAERALEILHPGPDGEPVGVDDLGLRYPSLVECTQAGSGALILPLGQGAGDAILWFRPEQARSITWGGNPTEHGTTDPVTGELCPRVSFAAWKEIVRGRSAPWTDADLSLARAFQRAFEVEVARRTKVALDLFDRAFESSPVAMVLTGRDGLIKILNRQVERMFGFGRAELEGARFDRLMPQRFRSEYAVATLRVLTDMSPCTLGNALDMFGLHKDGSEFPLELTLSPIDPIDFAGEPMMQASIENLTLQRVIEREKIEAERDKEQKRHELEQSNADLEEFAYAISHDLKAPLRAIGHLAGWIEEDIAGAAKPETRENMKLLQGRVVRMQKLLDGLLEYSCLRHTDKSIEDVDIADVVRDVVAMLEVPPGFVVAYEGDASVIRTERVAIQLVLDNLISNALRHHDRTSGRVDVAMQRVDGVAEIRVKDDGPGIAAQFHRRIFTIFQTLKSRDTLESSGIGLAIVKRKVEIHGGQIWVESAPPARGSTFVFTWNETAK